MSRPDIPYDLLVLSSADNDGVVHELLIGETTVFYGRGDTALRTILEERVDGRFHHEIEHFYNLVKRRSWDFIDWQIIEGDMRGLRITEGGRTEVYHNVFIYAVS